MDGSVLEKKIIFLDARVDFSSKLDWCSFAKSASKKIEALFVHSMKFLSPEDALYLCKSTIRPCMEYSRYVWVGAPNCYL